MTALMIPMLIPMWLTMMSLVQGCRPAILNLGLRKGSSRDSEMGVGPCGLIRDFCWLDYRISPQSPQPKAQSPNSVKNQQTAR